jgi:hypothetical protein
MPFPTHSKQYARINNGYKVKREGELKQKYIKSQIYNLRALH